jgi:serine/threonine protein kinase
MADDANAAPEPAPTGDFSDRAGGVPPGPSEALTVAQGVPAPSVARPAIPGFEILTELGRGGMGVVYKARQLSLGRPVALKVILAGVHASAKDRARFRREAETAAQLQHPNVVQIYEVGEAQGIPFLAMELVEGGTLADRPPGKPVPPRLAGELLEVLARAVHAAHCRGIIHRDLKPANILLPKGHPGQGLPAAGTGAPGGDRTGYSFLPSAAKIADFGLAKSLDSGQGAPPGDPTQTGEILGTPSYMAPELAGGNARQVGAATDVYALGAVLYELLTGTPPFRAATPLDTLLLVISQEPRPPRRLEPRVPRDLETICLKCLQKDPGRRYATAEALAEDLRRWLAGEPIQARPVGPLERTARAVRRRSPLILALAAGMLIVAALSWWGRVGRSPSAADPPPGGTAEAPEAGDQELAPLPPDLDLVPRDAQVFLTCQLSDLLGTEGVKRLFEGLEKEFPQWREKLQNWQEAAQKDFGLRPDEVERLTVVYLSEFDRDEPVVVLYAAQPHEWLKPQRLAALGLEGTPVGGRTFYKAAEAGVVTYYVNDRIVLQSPRLEHLSRFLDKPVDRLVRNDLRRALDRAAQEKHHVSGGLVLTGSTRQSLKPLLGSVATSLVEARSALVTVDVRSSVLGDDAGDLFLLDGRLAFDGEREAAAGRQGLHQLVEFVRARGKVVLDQARAGGELAAPHLEQVFPINPAKLINQFLLALEGLQVFQERRELRAHLILPADLAKLGVAQARLLDQMSQHGLAKHADNLKKLAEAALAYETRQGRLPPPAITSPDGKPLLSWRVAILPYLGEEALYREFRLDEPWDVPHNRELLGRMPAVFRYPPTAPADATHYQVFVGPGSAFEGPAGVRLAEITDGRATTILIVEAAEAVPWTKPADLPYAADKELPKLGSNTRPFFLAAFGDGEVQLIRMSADVRMLRRAITRNDGQPLNLKDITFESKPPE